MVSKLLRKNISVGQMAGYAVANLTGMIIILCAIQFYNDVSVAFSDSETVVGKDYLIISKPVSTLGTFGLGSDNGFSAGDVSELESQPWVRRVGAFKSADFSVQASINMGGRSMSTFLFLESVPDDFLDVSPREWGWTPGNAVPVIISKDYLSLYNFGFAASRGLPQLSEGVVSNVPLILTLGSGSGRAVLPARIVGFSGRFNTIAVPDTFLTWANARFAPADGVDDATPSRLAVEVSRPGDPAITQYMQTRGYEVAGDKADSGRAGYLLMVVTAIVATVGAVITLLAFFVLTLSLFLLLQKSRDKLHQLMLLGYSPGQAGRPFALFVSAVNVVILAVSIAVLYVASGWWQQRLSALGLAPASLWCATLTAVALTVVVTVLSLLTIRRLVRRAF